MGEMVMRMIVWLVWAVILGGILGAAGVRVTEHPIWFILIDGAFLMASWNAFNLLWPAHCDHEEGQE